MKSQLWQRLRAARRYAGLRQEDVRQVCGVTRSAVAQWEAEDPDKRTQPSIDQIKAIAKLTKLPLDFLLNDNADPDDVWRMGTFNKAAATPTMSSVYPAISPSVEGGLPSQATARFEKAFQSAVEFALMQDGTRGVNGFECAMPFVAKGATPDFCFGNLIAELRTTANKLMDCCGRLLLAERALGAGERRKAIIILDPQRSIESTVDAREIHAMFGIEIICVTSPEEAARFIESAI